MAFAVLIFSEGFAAIDTKCRELHMQELCTYTKEVSIKLPVISLHTYLFSICYKLKEGSKPSESPILQTITDRLLFFVCTAWNLCTYVYFVTRV